MHTSEPQRVIPRLLIAAVLLLGGSCTIQFLDQNPPPTQPDPTDPNPPGPMCGNGVLDAGEVCDDGNTVSGDGCSADCQSTEVCGNGILDVAAGEVCDDGNAVSGDGCSADCQSTEVCGNGILDPGEECEVGMTSQYPCSPSCRLEYCGNGVLDPGEFCDDGNNTPGDGCPANCVSDAIVCGNGLVELGEVCDDGNVLNGDGCSADCLSTEVCGNGIVDLGEMCDTAGASATCDADCTVALCGDAVVNPAAGEQCDDGNVINGDGCESDCTLTP
jgi:cysteine-rich repeat protein